MSIKDHLTEVDYGNGVTSSKQAVPGMFHFSGTGPAGAVCRDCKHRTVLLVKGPKDSEGKVQMVPSMTHMLCGKTLEYFNFKKNKTKEIPMHASACKYFEKKEL